MKRYFIFLAQSSVFLMLLISCRKDSETLPHSIIKFIAAEDTVFVISKSKIQYNFLGMLIGDAGVQKPSSRLTFWMQNFGVSLSQPTVIGETTYSDSFYSNSNFYSVTMSYTNAQQVQFQTDNTAPKANVTFTKVTDKNIRGNFFGTLLKAASSDTLQITEGYFDIYTYQ
ncbi:MAG: hypothetical protein ACK4GL_02335 [Flavobacteriales bacterium]